MQQIQYPAWANTGTQRWFYRQYYNATPWQIVKFIFWSALIGIVLITNVAEEVSRRMRESRNDAFVPPAQVIATPATPAPSAPASAPFAPPPVDFISPAFSGPPTIPQIVEARAGVVRVAQGISENNRQLVDAGMTELMRAVPEERRKHASHLRAGYHNRFRDFLSRMLPASSAQRRDERHSLASQLQTDAYDAEAACEWSWLAMADNELDHARNGFLRAIWADPQYSCGWLGYGTVASNDTGMSFGSLVMAERLELGNADEYAQRDQFVESTFMPESRQLERWRIMDARARVQAALSRNASAPPEIEKRAEKTLPRL